MKAFSYDINDVMGRSNAAEEVHKPLLASDPNDGYFAGDFTKINANISRIKHLFHHQSPKKPAT